MMHIVYIAPPRACLRGEFSRLSMHTTGCLLLMTHLPAQNCHLRFRVGFLGKRGRRCFNGGSMCIVKRAHAFHYSLYPLIKIMSFLWVSVICCRFRISVLIISHNIWISMHRFLKVVPHDTNSFAHAHAHALSHTWQEVPQNHL